MLLERRQNIEPLRNTKNGHRSVLDLLVIEFMWPEEVGEPSYGRMLPANSISSGVVLCNAINNG